MCTTCIVNTCMPRLMRKARVVIYNSTFVADRRSRIRSNLCLQTLTRVCVLASFARFKFTNSSQQQI